MPNRNRQSKHPANTTATQTALVCVSIIFKITVDTEILEIVFQCPVKLNTPYKIKGKNKNNAEEKRFPFAIVPYGHPYPPGISE